jgi:PAS domain S-box-containing protein
MKTESSCVTPLVAIPATITFNDIFDLAEVQRMQDLFADATGVASVITRPDGTPITKPSNFCRLCKDIIRKTTLGFKNCCQSDAVLGRHNPGGPIIQPCLSGGLWDAGASITVGGVHIANWLIGQVRNETTDEARMLKYADEIRADREDFMQALAEVPVMPITKFQKIAEMLFVFANELSEKAYKNFQLKQEIAEREHTALQLRNSEEALATMLNSIGDAVIATDLDGNVNMMNPVAERLTGWDFADAKGKPLLNAFNIVNAVTRKIADNPVMKVITTGKVAGLANHTVLISRTGTEYQISDSAAPIRDAAGNIRGVIMVFSDVTEKYQAEVALRRSEEKFRTVADFTYDWEYWHIHGKIIYISPSCERISGYKPEEFLSDNSLLRKIIHPDDVKIFDEHYNRMHSPEHLRDVEEISFRIIKKDGTVAHLTHLCSPVFDKQDNYLGRRASNRDDTVRKQAEAELKKNQAAISRHNELLSVLLKNLPVGVFMVEVPSGKPLVVNEAAMNLLGRGIMPDTSKHNLAEVYEAYREDTGEPYPVEDMPIVKAMQGVFSRTDDMRVRRPDGSETLLEIFGSPVMDQNGQVWAGLTSFIDISRRKQAEAETKQKNHFLVNLLAEKDKFFSIIAHDLRSPFNGFLGLTQIMADNLPDLSMTEIRQLAESTRNSAVNVYGLLENLLEWTKAKQGLMPFTLISNKLVNVVNESMAPLLESARRKEIEIAVVIPEDIAIWYDSNMFKTIIRNLVSNAIKFTRKGGKISVSAAVTKSQHVEICVQDSGIGMHQQMLDNLFRIDVKVSRKGTENEPSSGLGLLLCKEFVEKHGGTIRVESEEDKGSQFYFTIPLKLDQAQYDSHTKQLKILIADDDEESETLLFLLVNKFGREVLKAGNGAEAVEICRSHPDLDLVLMDVAMPVMDGYEAVRQIRQFNQNVIIIAQTANFADGESERAAAAGCNDFITKPYNRASLSAILHKHFTNIVL